MKGWGPVVTTCATCGEPWGGPIAGSKLTGHARCALTPEQQDEAFDLSVKEMISQPELARRYNVSMGVIRASFMVVRKRRGMKPGHWGG